MAQRGVCIRQMANKRRMVEGAASESELLHLHSGWGDQGNSVSGPYLRAVVPAEDMSGHALR